MRNIINFNRKWAFRKGEATPPDSINPLWDLVNLPHTWNNLDGQDGGNDYFRGKGCYAKKLIKNELPENERYFLEVKGANSSCEVFLNGEKIANHDGGYSTWRVELTDKLKDESLLCLICDNSENDRVYPQMADFTFYGGLYRDVNIIGSSDAHFDLMYHGGPGLSVTPVVGDTVSAVVLTPYLKNAKEGMTVLYEIFDRENKKILSKEVPAKESQTTLTLTEPHLWQGIQDPYLYTVRAYLKKDGAVLDNVFQRFGLRRFHVDKDRGFFLNGRHYPLRGVSRHQDRWEKGNALSPDDHKEDMELICEVGANTVRLAHYQHDKRFYDLCDEKGIIVWAEIPYISKQLPHGEENAFSQMTELIVQNYNHPSIAFWGLSNEITMNGSDKKLLEHHKKLNDLCHELDSTRLTTLAAVSMCSTDDPYLKIPDVVAYNHYFGWYGGETDDNGKWFDDFHKKHPDIPIACSEYGCEALGWHTSDPVQGDYTEEYQAHYHEELIKQLFTRDYIWATYVWNMFDFGADARNEGGENGQNHKGLVTFDRRYKKDAFYAYKAWLSDEPFVHICGKRYVNRTENPTRVTVYSNQPEVELFCDCESLGKQSSDSHFFYFDVPNMGESHLIAEAGKLKDTSVIKKVESFHEPYRLKEKGAVLNWFDIKEKEGFFSLNSKVGDIIKTPEGEKLFEGLISEMMKNGTKAAGFEINENMLHMMKGFTVLRLITLMSMTGVTASKQELLKLNEKLNGIEAKVK